MKRRLLTNGCIVTPLKIIEAGTVVVEEGKIIDIVEHSYPANQYTWDVGGHLILPGIINLHDDGYEKAVQPRPGTYLPAALAFHHMERAQAASGITTIYHAVEFGEGLLQSNRTIAQAEEMTWDLLAFAQTDFAQIHHRILYRCEMRTVGSLDSIIKIINSPQAPAGPYYLSLNDHAPGQGQYAWRQAAQSHWDFKAQTEHLRSGQLEQATELLKSRSDIIIAGHDSDSIAAVDDLYERGMQVCEFPVSREAAQHAQKLNLPVIVGAPNIVRGGSHTKNVSALELVADHLADVLVADYAPSTLLHAVFMLVEQQVLTLVEAVKLVTLNAARVVGLEKQTGSIAPGLAADLIVVETRANPPLSIVQLILANGNINHRQPLELLLPAT